MNQDVMAVNSLNYHAYLVRVWRDNEQGPWRASTTHVTTGEVHKFASPQLLWGYLQLQLQTPDVEANGLDPPS